MSAKQPRTIEGVLAQLKEEQQLRAVALSRGTARDFAEYQKLAGEISGLALAENMLKALLELIDNDDELGLGPTPR
jgi:hypothetical protein